MYTILPSEDRNRFYLKVDGLFNVEINRTSEGLIIDVYNRRYDNCIATLAADNEEAA